MKLGETERLFVLTGAGVSVESGLATFRGSDGLWNGYRLTEVATPEAWVANKGLVWKFYSMRRREALGAEPNAAHKALAEMARRLGERFYLCTQNVDDLHERAGSTRAHHMHGKLFESRCIECEEPFADSKLYEDAGRLPVCSDCGAAVRPHIVWFGERPLELDAIFKQLEQADVLLVTGTSGHVYPAAGFVEVARRRGIRTIYVGPERPVNADEFDEIVLGEAGKVLPKLLAGMDGE